ncbi:hypothetical protein FHW69_002882 [Luteibacter sp. Sphag1AF]|uniref:DUF1552 domain-containing protein n=1 Tax=Luteibacter sp. Sphag1AF TaxID=2587031 RepID=UPI001607F4BB|nr:DUF1552 domain-containing protein [Luteibacter sp. Sphag1AF]MBB3228247.1 hypothetical protein [Luteibacter sp. Sphag1AF]
MDILKSRRRFLAGLAAAGVLAPLSASALARMVMAPEREQALLKIVLFVVPDGVAVDSFNGGGFGDGKGLWHPLAQGVDTTDFILQDVSKELEVYRNQSLYIRGTMVGAGNVGHDEWHRVLRDNAASMSSIDMILSQAMVGDNPAHRAIYSGPHAGTDDTHWNVSWNDNIMRMPQQDPYALFESVFGKAATAGGRSTRSGNLLDQSLVDIQQLVDVTRGAQRERLLTTLDSIKKTHDDLGQVKPPPPECGEGRPEQLDYKAAKYRTQTQANHHTVVATILACRISRVATIQVGRSAESLNILDVTDLKNPHECAHRTAGEEAWRGTRQWYVRQVKNFLDELARHPDPDVPGDNLLKHTLVIVTSEMADGAPEHTIDMPLVMLGGASGLLQSGDGKGRYLNVVSQADRTHHTGNPVIGNKFVDMQRIWATVAKMAGTSVPYGGNVEPVTGIFTNVT